MRDAREAVQDQSTGRLARGRIEGEGAAMRYRYLSFSDPQVLESVGVVFS